MFGSISWIDFIKRVSMTQIVFGLVISAGALAMIYRIYLSFTENREKVIETKQSDAVTKDEQKDSQDAKTSQNSTDAFNNAVADFERDNKS